MSSPFSESRPWRDPRPDEYEGSQPHCRYRIHLRPGDATHSPMHEKRNRSPGWGKQPPAPRHRSGAEFSEAGSGAQGPGPVLQPAGPSSLPPKLNQCGTAWFSWILLFYIINASHTCWKTSNNEKAHRVGMSHPSSCPATSHTPSSSPLPCLPTNTPPKCNHAVSTTQNRFPLKTHNGISPDLFMWIER